jgi:hypothetical protein
MGNESSETEILFPIRKVGDFFVQPFTFGQLGAALRILAPCVSSLDTSAGQFDIASINLAVLIYAVTENDSAAAFELMHLATGADVDRIKALPIEDGFDLLKAVFEVAIAPAFEVFKKKFPGTAKAEETKPTAGQT